MGPGVIYQFEDVGEDLPEAADVCDARVPRIGRGALSARLGRTLDRAANEASCIAGSAPVIDTVRSKPRCETRRSPKFGSCRACSIRIRINVPAGLVAALGPHARIANSKWAQLRPIDRYVLTTLALNTRLLFRALREIMPEDTATEHRGKPRSHMSRSRCVPTRSICFATPVLGRSRVHSRASRRCSCCTSRARDVRPSIRARHRHDRARLGSARRARRRRVASARELVGWWFFRGRRRWSQQARRPSRSRTWSRRTTNRHDHVREDRRGALGRRQRPTRSADDRVRRTRGPCVTRRRGHKLRARMEQSRRHVLARESSAWSSRRWRAGIHGDRAPPKREARAVSAGRSLREARAKLRLLWLSSG